MKHWNKHAGWLACCGTCSYNNQPRLPEDDSLYCQRYPPPWEVVQEDDWCGEYKIEDALPSHEEMLAEEDLDKAKPKA